MIQRIQSVYLFLALLALGALFSRLPLIKPIDIATADSLNEGFFIAQEILFGLSALLTFAGIFLYANRKRQMVVVKLAIVLTVFGLIAFGVEYFVLNGKLGAANLKLDPFALIGTVALILQVMGNRGIAADEKLVRSADRLR